MSAIAAYGPNLRLTGDDEPAFRPGERIRIATRSAGDRQRMPFYLRGKRGTVEAVLEPAASNPADARSYRLAIPLTEIWPDYVGSPQGGFAHRGSRTLARAGVTGPHVGSPA